MAFQPSVDSFDIRLLVFKCSWWHPRQANDAVVSERSIFSENHDYIKVFPCRCEPVCTYISGSRCAWWQKTTNRHTVHACQGLIMIMVHYTLQSRGAIFWREGGRKGEGGRGEGGRGREGGREREREREMKDNIKMYFISLPQAQSQRHFTLSIVF